MVDGIGVAVELEGFEIDFFAEGCVEGGGCFDPLIIEEDTGVAVPVEDVGLHSFLEAVGGEVVADVGVAECGGYFDGTTAGSEEGGFGDAPAVLVFESSGSFEALDREIDVVGVVVDLIADGEIEFDDAAAG